MDGIGSQCIVQQTPQNAQEERGVRMVCGLEGGMGCPIHSELKSISLIAVPKVARLHTVHCQMNR